MKLLTIDCREITGRPGVLLPGGDILDLAAAPSTLSESQWIPHSVVSVLAAGPGGLERVARLVTAVGKVSEDGRAQLRHDGVLLPFAGTTLMPPIRRPGLVLVVGDDGTTYLKSPNTAAGNQAKIDIPWNDDAPPVCSGMLAAVIGRPFYRTNAAEVSESLAGFTLVLDLSIAAPGDTTSAADWSRYYESKQFPGACPIGPAIVTADEFGAPQTREAQLLINDVEVAAGPVYAHAEALPDRLAALSQRYGFRPGDLVCFEPATGHATRECRLHAGDRVSWSLPGLMELQVEVS